MKWVDRIFSLVWDISDLFYNAYLEVKDWMWPLYYLQYPLYGLYNTFWSLLTPIAHFSDWVYDVNDKLSQVFSIGAIKAFLKDWLDWAEWSWSWVQGAWYYVTGRIDDWWLSTQNTVKGWITAATQGFNELITAWSDFWTITWPEWMGQLEALRAGFNEFWTITFPTLVSFTWLPTWWNEKVKGVQDLIDTAFTLRESWWSGWEEVKEQVFEFFTNPLDWLIGKLEDWFWGEEEL